MCHIWVLQVLHGRDYHSQVSSNAGLCCNVYAPLQLQLPLRCAAVAHECGRRMLDTTAPGGQCSNPLNAFQAWPRQCSVSATPLPHDCSSRFCASGGRRMRGVPCIACRSSVCHAFQHRRHHRVKLAMFAEARLSCQGRSRKICASRSSPRLFICNGMPASLHWSLGKRTRRHAHVSGIQQHIHEAVQCG